LVERVLEVEYRALDEEWGGTGESEISEHRETI
jgi:hypothetical protein